ncbi:MAG TPA: hypothetical protein VKE70_06335 [Candidatus Solibacter sp.]|nr:hypothetical protein [Candidatus Solibacter sp.]
MALFKEWLLPLASVVRAHGVEGPALGLGDQQTLFTPQYALKHLGRRGLLANPGAKITGDHVHPECISFRSVLGLLGINDYSDLDMNGKAALNVDFGKPLSQEHYGIAGSVFDLGTLEHVFDIGEAFRNIHRLLRPGGCVIHFSPVTLLNHGLWNLNPQVFFGFYELNGFELLDHAVIFSPLYTLWSVLVGNVIREETERRSLRERVVVRIDSRSPRFQHFCNYCFHPPRMIQFFAARKRQSSGEVRSFYQV